MARFYGMVGYAIEEETALDVWTPKIVERPYFGDVVRDSMRWKDTSDKLNNDLVISNSISIVADPYAYENVQHIKYVTWMGTRWKVTGIDVEYPRIRLSIGEVWNAKEQRELSEHAEGSD